MGHPSPPVTSSPLTQLLLPSESTNTGQIDNEPQSYQWTAIKTIGTMHMRLQADLEQLTGVLAASGGMAGSDAPGRKWAESYDKAAIGTEGNALEAAASLVNAAGVFHNLMAATGFNYEAADTAASPFILTQPSSLPGNKPIYLPPAVPSAFGGESEEPSFWSMIVPYVQGEIWPNGQQGKLRAVAAAWSTAGQDITSRITYLNAAETKLCTQKAPELDDILTALNNLNTQTKAVGEGFLSIADECEKYAQAIDDAHSQILSELSSLLGWTVAIEAAAITAGLVSFGSGTVAMQAVAVGRLTAAGARIATIIRTFARTVESMGMFGPQLAGTFAGTRGALAGWQGAEPIIAAINTSGERSGGFRSLNILSDLTKGSNKDVWVVSNYNQLEAVFSHLSIGGRDITPISYNGKMVLMPDGTKVGLRLSSSSGGETIDIFPPNGRPKKVHILP